MHELGITQNIIEIVAEQAQGLAVQRVVLEIGQLSAILPDSIQFCFDVCRQGTLLETATLEIIEIPGVGKCRHCGTEVFLDQPFGVCPHCNSIELEIVQGEELKIKEIEVESQCV